MPEKVSGRFLKKAPQKLFCSLVPLASSKPVMAAKAAIHAF
jgi:hypothetical protein